jgi:hypothetical protein
MSKLLFILDWTLFLPVTLVRLGVMYFQGSKYNIDGLKFLDVMMHSDNKYFNQTQDSEPSIDTTTEDVRKIIKYDSHLYEMTEIKTNLVENIFKKEEEEEDKEEEKKVNFTLNNNLISEINQNIDSNSDSGEKSDSDSNAKSNSETNSEFELTKKESEDYDENEENNLDFLIKSAKIKINNMMQK